MSFANLKFIYVNMLCAAELRIRMDALCIATVLVNIVATTIEDSFVRRSFGEPA